MIYFIKWGGSDENESGIKKYFISFSDALQKGMDYVNTHTPEEIAQIIQPQFAETELDTLTKIVTRYYEQDTWKEDVVFEQSSFKPAISTIKLSKWLNQFSSFSLIGINFHN